MNHNEKGSATLHSLFAAVLLLTALTAATFWSTISTARHKLATAADLTALSAAESLTTNPATALQPTPVLSPATVLNPTPVLNPATVLNSPTVLNPATVVLPAAAPQPTTVTSPAAVTEIATSTGPAVAADPITGPCATAARVAALHKVHLTACDPTPTSVTVQVALQLDLPFSHPTLTATSRAGPI